MILHHSLYIIWVYSSRLFGLTVMIIETGIDPSWIKNVRHADLPCLGLTGEVRETCSKDGVVTSLLPLGSPAQAY